MRFLSLFGILIYTSLITAQEQAWVFFTDKPGATTALEQPSTFLTQKALTRKAKFGIPIDERDLPVPATYVSGIKAQAGITYYSTSKWFNAVYVEGTFEDVNALAALSYVDSVFFMDRSLNTDSTLAPLVATSTQARRVQKLESLDTAAVNAVTNVTDPQISQIGLDALHDEGYQGEGMTIAVMDDGFVNVDQIAAFDRARANGHLLGGYDFERHTDAIYETAGSHGTQVLSTMLGYIENSFKGTAIDADYYLFKTEIGTSESPREEALWIAAAERADSLGVDLINTSLGYTTFENAKYDYTVEDMDGQTTFISQGVNMAFEKGMLPITSAGNLGSSSWRIVSAPADAQGTLAIGAVSATGVLASFSSRGYSADGRVKPDLVARGNQALVVGPTGTVGTSSGTSFSGPIFCGAVACLWQRLPDFSPAEIRDLVRQSANRYATPNNLYGYGIPNLALISETGEILSLEDQETDPQTSEDLGAENETEQWLLYGNIVDSGYLPIEVKDTSLLGLGYQVFALSGELLYTGELTPYQELDLTNYTSGIYYLKVDDTSSVIKFVVK